VPTVSKKQFKKFYVLAKRGDISQQTLHEWTGNVDYKKLPERVKHPKEKRTKHNG